MEKNHFINKFKVLLSAAFLLSAVEQGNSMNLHTAAYLGQLGTVMGMITGGANVNEYDNFGNTPLHLAALQGHSDVVEFLVYAAGANINALNYYEETPSDLAEKSGKKDVVEFLRNYSAKN